MAVSAELPGSLAELIAYVGKSADVQLALLELTIRRAAVKDPQLAEALRYAAIPRRFDATIIGVLRERPDEEAGNQALVQALTAQQFVLPTADGSYTFEDSARETLLRMWRRTPEEREQFSTYNERLLRYYKAQHEETESLERDLNYVGGELRRANAERYARLNALVEEQVLLPLVEALYQATLEGARKAYDSFRDYAFKYETRGRHTIVDALRIALLGFLEHMEPDDDKGWVLRWLRYWEVRIAQALRRSIDAEALLQQLLAESKEHGETKLSMWVLSALDAYYEDDYQLGRAREILQQELDLSIESGEDVWNLPNIYQRLARLHVRFWEWEAVLDYCEKGKRAVEDGGNPSMVVYLERSIMEACLELGRPDEAFEAGLRALSQSRGGSKAERSLQREVAGAFQNYFVQDPQLQDAVYEEEKRLLPAVSDPMLELWHRFRYLANCRYANRVRQARATLRELRREPAARANGRFRAQLEFEDGDLCSLEGKHEEAIKRYSRILKRGDEPSEVDAWTAAAALATRGSEYVWLGRWDAAEADIEAASERWKKIGNVNVTGLMALFKTQARYAADAVTNWQRPAPVEGGSDSAARTYRQARLAWLHGRRGDALEAMATARVAVQEREHWASNAVICLEMARVFSEQADWEEAARLAREVVPLWQRAREAGGAPAAWLRAGDPDGRLAAVWRQTLENEPVAERASASSLADCLILKGTLAYDRGAWPEAREAWQRALGLRRRLRDAAKEADVLARLAALAAFEGDYGAALARSRAAALAWQHVSDINGYRAKHHARTADQANAEGMYAFSEESRRDIDLARAVSFFEKAVSVLPNQPWYLLNRAYAAAAIPKWDEAAEALEHAISASERWARSATLLTEAAAFQQQAGKAQAVEDPEGAYHCFVKARYWLRRVETQGLKASPRQYEVRLAIADGFLQIGRLDAAEAEYEAALAASSEDVARAQLMGRLALVAAARGELAATRDRLHGALHLRMQTEGGDPATVIIEAMAPLIHTLQQFRTLTEAARRLAVDESIDAERQQLLQEIHRAVNRRTYTRVWQPARQQVLEQAAHDVGPAPIALEAADHLFPDDVDDPPHLRLVNELLPAMRDRIEAQTGIRVPGVRLRAKDYWLDGDYSLLLHDVPIVGGRVVADQRFYPDAERAIAVGMEGEEGYDPLSGGQGIWAGDWEWDVGDAQGLTWWDPYQYLVAHLEVFLVENLAELIGVQETVEHLMRWVGDEMERQALWQQVAPDSRAMTRFVRVVQSLIEERVPITDLETILQTVSAQGADVTVRETVEAVRLALRPSLPGNQAERTVVRLPQEAEETVARSIQWTGDKRFLALLPSDIQTILEALRAGVAGRPPRSLALVVARADLRADVWSIVKLEYPSMIVLAEREVTHER